MSRTPLIAGNWKMFKTGTEAVDAAGRLAELAKEVTSVDIMIAPAHLSLPLVSQKLAGTNISTGAQNLFFEKEGAYTGEVSAEMIRDAGARYVIVGHSERRTGFGETDESVRKKIGAALREKLIPVMCVGESETQRDAKKTFSVLDKQVSNGLKDFDPDELDTLVLAYEPVWAIGTGRNATGDQVDDVHRHLRSLIGDLFGTGLADRIRILYGGSVKPGNIAELMAIADVDGALVGGASLDPDKFIEIVNFNN